MTSEELVREASRVTSERAELELHLKDLTRKLHSLRHREQALWEQLRREYPK